MESTTTFLQEGRNFVCVDSLAGAILDHDASTDTYTTKDPFPSNIKILDCSAGGGKDQKFKEERIPGAQFLDLNQKFIDPDGKYPSAYPTDAVIKHRLGELGVSKEHDIVCYVQDTATRFSTRALFIFKSFGFKRVAILAGGFEHWKSKNFPVDTSEPAEEEKTEFEGELEDANSHLVTYEDVKAMEEDTENNLIIDARPANEHNGEVDPQYKDAKRGKIPNSINIPSTDILKEDGSFKDVEELKEIFDKSGVDKKRKLVCHCNGGNQATIVAVALQEAGYENIKLYDGSWNEYGSKLE